MAKREKEIQTIYFIGIKGVAMSGLAIMAKELGFEVRGSDVAEQFITDSALHDQGITVYEEFLPENLAYKPDLVVVSAAFGASNPEVKAAKSLRLKTLTMSELLGQFVGRFEGVGVAGIHGKTTTTSLIAFVLKEAGYSPSYMIGTGTVPGLDGNAHIGDGQHFVVEADEYKKSETDMSPKFLDYPLKHVVITSIELDHPDVYTTPEQVYSAFYQLTVKIPRDGTIVACTDWPLVRRLVSRRVDRPIISYGFEASADYQLVNFEQHQEKISFWLKHGEEKIGPIELNTPGRHNALNAAAAFLLCHALGVDEATIVKALKHYEAPQRRFQLLGSYNGATIFDDYAHHPTALAYLIEAAKKMFPTKELVVVFQPHTYSRTGRFLTEFAESLKAADKLILLNIWASAREKSGYVTIKDLLDEVRKVKKDVEYRSTLDEVAQYLKGSLSAKNVVLLVGAGDVYKIYQKLQDN